MDPLPGAERGTQGEGAPGEGEEAAAAWGDVVAPELTLDVHITTTNGDFSWDLSTSTINGDFLWDLTILNGDLTGFNKYKWWLNGMFI